MQLTEFLDTNANEVCHEIVRQHRNKRIEKARNFGFKDKKTSVRVHDPSFGRSADSKPLSTGVATGSVRECDKALAKRIMSPEADNERRARTGAAAARPH